MLDLWEEQIRKEREEEKRRTKKFCMIVGGVLVGLVTMATAFSSFTVINTGERGVVLRMGKLERVMGEGFNFKMPIVENIIKTSVRDVNYPIETEVSSRDMQTIKIKASLIYSIDETKVGNVYQTYGERYADTLIKPTLLEIINSIIANYNIEDFVEKRSEISVKISKEFVSRVSASGIVTKSLLITEHDFSDEYNKAIEDKKVAEQKALKAKHDLERVKLEAEAQRQKQTSLSELIIKEKAIEKWDGKLPGYYSGGALPFITSK